MGRTYLFECEKCGYRAQVAGGTAEGAEFTVRTILCYDCKELEDVVTALKMPLPSLLNLGTSLKPRLRAKATRTSPSLAVVLNRLPLTGRVRTRWQHFRLSCPVSVLHRIREWQQPDKCPRCGVFLERSAIPFRQWD